MCPCFDLPATSGRPDFDFSIAEQIDGLLHCLFGIRIERDVLAVSTAAAICDYHGLMRWQCLSEDVGFYFGSLSTMPVAVAAAASSRACGIFVAPAVPQKGEVKIEVKSGKSGPRAIPWSKFLAEKADFTFLLPLDFCKPQLSYASVAHVVNFGANVKLKRKRRPELERGYIELQVQTRHHGRTKLATVPSLLHRVSPCAEELRPTRTSDTAAASRPFEPNSRMPSPRESPWNSEAFAAMTADFPHPKTSTRELALQVMDGTLDPFCGDRDKAVDIPAPQHSPEHVEMLRANFAKGIESGFQAGPFTQPPHAHARVANVYPVPKKKYDPDCNEIRAVHHLSQSAPTGASAHRGRRKGGPDPGSINALCYTPRWLTTYFQMRMLCDVLAKKGPGVTMSWRDVPKAFKRNPANKDLMFLHVTQLATGDCMEYYVELCNTFGWIPSEWGWQAELALMLWWMEHKGLPDLYAFVDNFFLVHDPAGAESAVSRAARFDNECERMGVDLHEKGDGTDVSSAMGWELDLDCRDHPLGWPMVMICPEVKYNFYRSKFSEWALEERLSITDLQSAAGIAQWLSQGMPMGAAYVAPLLALRTVVESTRRTRRGGTDHLRAQSTLRVTARARESLRFFDTFVSSWDRTCPILAHFGPTSHSERDGWVDASTTDGCGGVYWDPDTKTLLGFTLRWPREVLARAQCEHRESSGVLESYGILAWIINFESCCKQRRTLLRTDSEAAMLAFSKAFSEQISMLEPLRESRRRAGLCYMMLRVRQVNGKRFNVVADHLSHGRVEKAKCEALRIFGVQLVMIDDSASSILTR